MTDQALTSDITPASPAPRHTETVARFGLPRVFQILTRLLRRRRDRAHLSELPDYLLEDIGLTRADVPGRPPVGEGWR